jgi:hypothetical protein
MYIIIIMERSNDSTLNFSDISTGGRRRRPRNTLGGRRTKSRSSSKRSSSRRHSSSRRTKSSRRSRMSRR